MVNKAADPVTLDKATWHEIDTDEYERRMAHKETDINTLRRLFPFSLKVTRNDPRNGLAPGMILRFARAKRTPATFPFEVFNSKRERYAVYSPSVIVYAPDEAELIPAVD